MPKGNHKNHARGSQSHRWNDGKMLSPHGYVKVRIGRSHPLADPNGYCYEHKLVVAAAGIAVPDGHVIHHRNEDKTDNRLENLEVIPRIDHSIQHSGGALSDNDVRAIRDAYASGFADTTTLAEKYGVPHQRVWKIVKGMVRKSAGGPICSGSLRGKHDALPTVRS
ncbi:HNH endonuclease [Azospirillum tabaci]|uniref:HNH endonuclease n=1 Tax=Azospirillum tabaci TaxID=2752310 RepID=UPI001660DE75|nr:HNH endonuclease [Azospirillum tabaci]